MSLDLASLMAALVTHAQGVGNFERVAAHEFASAPGNGLSYGLWVSNAMPVPALSGLTTTTFLVTVTGRIYYPGTEASDGVDVQVMAGADALMAAYTGDFELGGLVEQVDLMGAYGQQPLGVTFRWAEWNESLYRIATITLPLVVTDLYAQAE
jgi:hypothetical protein